MMENKSKPLIEYLFLNERVDSSKENYNDQTLLVKYLESFKKTNIQEIVLNSIPFGGGNGTKLVIDHEFRKKGNLKYAKLSRQKNIFNVSAVPSIHIHESFGGNKTNVVRAPTENMRINHYKDPDRGVFVGGWGNGGQEGPVLKQEMIIKDSSLKDRFHDLLAEKYFTRT